MGEGVPLPVSVPDPERVPLPDSVLDPERVPLSVPLGVPLGVPLSVPLGVPEEVGEAAAGERVSVAVGDAVAAQPDVQLTRVTAPFAPAATLPPERVTVPKVTPAPVLT